MSTAVPWRAKVAVAAILVLCAVEAVRMFRAGNAAFCVGFASLGAVLARALWVAMR